jgi:hypothetical protein
MIIGRSELLGHYFATTWETCRRRIHALDRSFARRTLTEIVQGRPVVANPGHTNRETFHIFGIICQL